MNNNNPSNNLLSNQLMKSLCKSNQSFNIQFMNTKKNYGKLIKKNKLNKSN